MTDISELLKRLEGDTDWRAIAVTEAEWTVNQAFQETRESTPVEDITELQRKLDEWPWYR